MESNLYFNPPVIAHRGASYYAPENTMVAFVKAVQSGVQWIEFDVLLAACQQTIVFHDDFLERTTNGKGSIRGLPYSHLSSLDAGSWFSPYFSGERIPTFLSLLEFIDNVQINANVELKPLLGQEQATVQQVWQDIQNFKPSMLDTLLFSSFSHKALEMMRKIAPNCQLGLLMHEWEPDWQMLCNDLECVSVNVNHEIINAENAAKIKNTRRKLLCYTVNDPARAQELFSFGVDAVFSDVPDKILLSLR